MSLRRVELSTVLEIQIPLEINGHGIKCASNMHENKPCNCALVENEMLLFNDYNGTKCIKSRVIQLRLRRKHETSRKENSLNNPEITISDAFLVSSDKRQADEVTNILKRNHPGVRIQDMEMLLDGSPQVNASVNARNDLTSDQIWDRISNESSDNNVITTCIENGNESERLKNYENDLRRRRELNEHRAKEAALLRGSLRGSRKLLSLENQKSRKESSGYKNDALSNDNALETGYANSAYVAGDTFCDITGMDETGPIPLEQVMISMNRVVEHLEKAEGREEESKLLRDFFTQKPIQEAIENNIVIHKAAEPKPTTSAGLLSITNDCSGSKTLPSTRIQGDLKIVKVNKCSNTYLGATIRNEGERVIVGRVVGGGIAEKSNLLREGDELIEANGNDLRGKNITEVCNILRSMSGELSLVIASLDKSNDNSQTVSSTQVKHFRALFDYDPEDDIYVPCKELALKFQRGDILHVISMSDENWWQAYREGCEMNSSLAGLIPSMSFQRQVALYAREFERENQSENGKRKDFFGCTKRKNLIKGKWKKGEELKSMDELSDENDSEILIYEEVTLYLSKTGRKRPLVLCGPEGVGCLELRQRLAEFDKDKFASAIPHTTRPKKSGEIDGVHYHFVTKHSFQEDAKAGKFIEYGEFEKHLYGTSLASIQAVIDRAKICLLTLKAENLKALRRTTFMPFVVFIAPPSLQQLRRQKEILGQHGIKDEQLKLILSEGKTTEKHYGHLFDRIIVNVDLDRSLEELKEVIRKLETEPHWVPSFWPINTDSISSTKYDEKLIY
ncbi:Guanylate kinase family protein [Acanthocheilonema viteae]